jgi:hypothetical protein
MVEGFILFTCLIFIYKSLTYGNSMNQKLMLFCVHKEKERTPTNKDEEIDPSFYYTKFKKFIHLNGRKCQHSWKRNTSPHTKDINT